MIYVFVGTPEMVRAGKPFVYANQAKQVISEGFSNVLYKTDSYDIKSVRFNSTKRGKTFRCKNGDTYHAHAWVELS